MRTSLDPRIIPEEGYRSQVIGDSKRCRAGIYRENISKDGFKSIVKGEIELHVQDNASINFQMQVGSVTETVTVEGGAPLVNTTDGSVSTVVDRTFVQNIPLNGRSLQSLLAAAPGVVAVPGPTNG